MNAREIRQRNLESHIFFGDNKKASSNLPQEVGHYHRAREIRRIRTAVKLQNEGNPRSLTPTAFMEERHVERNKTPTHAMKEEMNKKYIETNAEKWNDEQNDFYMRAKANGNRSNFCFGNDNENYFKTTKNLTEENAKKGWRRVRTEKTLKVQKENTLQQIKENTKHLNYNDYEERDEMPTIIEENKGQKKYNKEEIKSTLNLQQISEKEENLTPIKDLFF